MIKKTNKSLDGTSFHGATFSATLADLQIILGAPNHTSDPHDKVQNEWELELEDGTIFTVYDWKEYRRYTDKETIEWHIGGRSQKDTFVAQDTLLEVLATMNVKPNLLPFIKLISKGTFISSMRLSLKSHSAQQYPNLPSFISRSLSLATL